jgi:hypothetical protein
VILGKKSTLFLAFAYQFDVVGNDHFETEGDKENNEANFDWKRRRIEGAALLPHLDDYVRKGELLRAYDVVGDLRGAFGPADRWTLTDGKKTVDIHITEPPRIYTFDTRYIFLVVGISPAAPLPPEVVVVVEGATTTSNPPAVTTTSSNPPAARESNPTNPSNPPGSDPTRTSNAPKSDETKKKQRRGKAQEPELTLVQLEDVAYYVVRAGVSKVKTTPIQMQRWMESKKLSNTNAEGQPLTLRRWFAQLVPNLPADAPRGTPRTQAPALFSVVLASSKVPEDDLHRLRLMHRNDQQVEPGSSILDDEHGAWRCSSSELVMFSSFGFSWVVENFTSSKFLSDTTHMIRDRYVYKWLIVEHQRLCLLALATECADMSKGLDGSNFAVMRMRLLTFIAKYNFRHISNEERHDRFYMKAQTALSIDDLLAEVREEVVEIDTQLSARRAELLNHVLAFLTLVLTPVGIIVGIFQTETLPGKFQLRHLITPAAYLKLFQHGPFIIVMMAVVLGIIVYVRLFGIEVVAQLIRTFLAKKRSRQDPEIH